MGRIRFPPLLKRINRFPPLEKGGKGGFERLSSSEPSRALGAHKGE